MATEQPKKQTVKKRENKFERCPCKLTCYRDGYTLIGILKKNGFVCLGTVYDDEDENVLEWELKFHNT